jgi:hypothetical protein
LFFLIGGKVKPLKQAKKAAKDLDEDDLAFLEKKRAGTVSSDLPTLRADRCLDREQIQRNEC